MGLGYLWGWWGLGKVWGWVGGLKGAGEGVGLGGELRHLWGGGRCGAGGGAEILELGRG